MSSVETGFSPVSIFASKIANGVREQSTGQRGFSHSSETMQLAWQQNPDRFEKHRNRNFCLPSIAKHHPNIRDTFNRIDQLFKNQKVGDQWFVQPDFRGIDHSLFYHTGNLTRAGKNRKVRSQRNTTDYDIFKYLLYYTNFRIDHSTLKPYQLIPRAIDTMSRELGLSKSTINSFIRRYGPVTKGGLGLLATKRQISRNAVGELEESTAIRFLAPRFFHMLGMSKRFQNMHKREKVARDAQTALQSIETVKNHDINTDDKDHAISSLNINRMKATLGVLRDSNPPPN